MSMSEQELAEIRGELESTEMFIGQYGINIESAERFLIERAPALLAEVERLRAELDEWKAQAHRYGVQAANFSQAVEDQSAENAALREMADFAREVARELVSPKHRIAGTQVVHLPDELMAKARALLGETQEQEQEQERTKASE